MEAAARHRRLHDVRPLHERLPGPRHRASRSTPARSCSRPARSWRPPARRLGLAAASASTARSPSPANSLFERITAEEIWSCTTLQGVRRDLPGQHRDPRQDPRHAALPVADGEQLPGRARQRLPGDGEPGQPVGHEPGRAGRLGQGPRRRRSSTRPSRSATSTSTGSAAPARSTTRTRRSPRRWPSCCSGPASTSPSSARPRCAPATPARRSGNEYLFQMLAMPNIEMLNGMGVKKIITQCPHCFNTLKNEYPQLGGNYEVVHHSQLLEQLIETGQLDVATATLEERVTYHDSLLPRPPQRRVPRAPQGDRLAEGHRDRRDAAQRHQGHVLRRRRGAHVDGGVDRQEGERRAGPGGALAPARPGSPPPARSATSCSTTA